MNRKPLIILTGPTAAGKSDLAVRLAQRIGGEIISADSMQVYRQMDIGTAKIRTDEMQGVAHHLIDVKNPDEPFNVVIFQDLAKDAMKKIYAKGHIPILTWNRYEKRRRSLWKNRFYNPSRAETFPVPGG